MKAIAPPHPGIHPDRFLQCQEALADSVSEVALAGMAAGWRAEEVAAALVELADHAMLAVLANRELERDVGLLRRR